MAKFNITVDLDWLDEEENLDERLKDEILQKIVSTVEGNITKSLEEKARVLLEERVGGFENVISQKLNSFMEEFFNTPKDITDKWGNVKKQGVTVTNLLAEACDNFLLQSVDERGNPATGYSAKYNTRVDYIVSESIDSNLEWSIKKAVEDVTKKLQNRISSEIKVQMGERLAGIVGLDGIISGKDAKQA